MDTRILALDISGTPFRWLTIEQAASKVVAKGVSWSLGDNPVILRGGIQNSGIQSQIEIPPVIALYKSEGMVKHMGEIKLGRDNRPLFARDYNSCVYCNAIDVKLTRDHIIPTSQGGKDIWANVACSCINCNLFKGAKTPEQAKMKLSFLPYTPNRFEHFILSNRKILVDQNEYLRSRIPQSSRIWLNS